MANTNKSLHFIAAREELVLRHNENWYLGMKMFQMPKNTVANAVFSSRIAKWTEYCSHVTRVLEAEFDRWAEGKLTNGEYAKQINDVDIRIGVVTEELGHLYAHADKYPPRIYCPEINSPGGDA